MWKIIVGFIIFAAVAMFVMVKGGGNLDMSGEKHGADAVHAPEPAASAATATPAPAAASAATSAAAGASAPAPAASAAGKP